MATRRFSDDFPDEPNPFDSEQDAPPVSEPVVPPPPQETRSQRPPSLRRPSSLRETTSEHRAVETPQHDPPPRRPRGRDSNASAHLPRTLTQVISDANDKVVRGDLVDYVPMPTGFDPLDGFIGGGLRKTELVLLGGAQGIGKTIATLQIARNIASRPDQYAFYLSYEHTETHLMHRLLCMESINPPEVDLSRGLKLRDLYQIIVAQRAKEFMGRDGGAGSLQAILRDNPKTAPALARMQRYSDRLILLKASPAVTNLRSIKELTARLSEATGGNVTLFIDYLQKIAVHPERPRDENDKVTIIVEGLKDIGLSLDVPVWAIVAADREGLKSKRIHLFHLRGSSALDYESDIAIIMNNKYQIMAKDHVAFNPYNAKQYRNWVVWTIEKNRAGRAMQDMEFEIFGQHFSFNPRGQKVQQQLIDDKLIES